jgi:uncharacterized heparinase superfamily protein
MCANGAISGSPRRRVLLFDAAPAAAGAPRAHGCASTLAFEFSRRAAHRRQLRRRGCVGGLLPVRLEQGLRATAAHSTLVLDDANSTAC